MPIRTFLFSLKDLLASVPLGIETLKVGYKVLTQEIFLRDKNTLKTTFSHKLQAVVFYYKHL